VIGSSSSGSRTASSAVRTRDRSATAAVITT
jgi:hypothetical protein